MNDTSDDKDNNCDNEESNAKKLWGNAERYQGFKHLYKASQNILALGKHLEIAFLWLSVI